MTIEINGEKTAHILLKIRKYLQNSYSTIRKLTPIVGSDISTTELYKREMPKL